MSKHTQVPWTPDIVYGVSIDGCLTKREAEHLYMRIIEHKSRVEIGKAQHLSVDGVDKQLIKIKAKYDNCHRQDPIKYPERNI